MILRKELSGRPKGSSVDKKRKYNNKISEAQYTIIIRYLHEIELLSNRNVTKRSIFFNILTEEKRNFNLNNTFRFPYLTAISRIRRSSLKAQGVQCPLIHIEQKLIDLILCMSKIKRSLTVTEALHLVNELIDGTEIQNMLIQWKIKHRIFYNDIKDLGTVGKIGGSSFSREINIC